MHFSKQTNIIHACRVKKKKTHTHFTSFCFCQGTENVNQIQHWEQMDSANECSHNYQGSLPSPPITHRNVQISRQGHKQFPHLLLAWCSGSLCQKLRCYWVSTYQTLFPWLRKQNKKWQFHKTAESNNNQINPLNKCMATSFPSMNK